MKSTSTVAILVAVLVAAGCVDREAQAQAKETEAIVKSPVVEVSVTEVVRRDILETIEISGEIVSPDDASVSTEIPGRLTAVYVREGDQVNAGQVVAQLDTTELNAQVRQSRAQVDAARSAVEQAKIDASVAPSRSSASVRAAQARLDQSKASLAKALAGARVEEKRQAEAQLEAARTNMQTAESDLDRTQRLFDQGAVSERQLEQAMNAFAAARSQFNTAQEAKRLVDDATRPEDIEAARQAVRAAEEQLQIEMANQKLDGVSKERVTGAEANLRSAQESLRLAQEALSDATIRAPFSGKVSGRPLRPGSYVAPGLPIVRLVGLEGVYLEAEVPESSIARVEQGTYLDVQLDALPGEQFRGEVVGIDPLPSSVGRLFSVRVRLLGTTEKVRPGMFAKAKLELGRLQGVTVVPEVAVSRDGETAYVYVIADGVAKRTEVQTGVREGNLIEVSGLDVGQSVAIRGLSELFEGAEVTLATETESE